MKWVILVTKYLVVSKLYNNFAANFKQFTEMATKKHKLSTAEVIRNAEQIFHRLRWKYEIVVCPYCGSMHIRDYGNYHYKCNSCKNRFTDKTKTLMHGSKLSISTWLQAIYELSVDNMISDGTLAIKLGISINSAWLLHKKIQYSLPQDRYILEGIVAQDEMYVGGSLSNYHYSRKWKLLRDGHFVSSDETRYSKAALFSLNSSLKQPVFGMNDGKQIVLFALPNRLRKEYLYQLNKKHVAKGSITVSDESALYNEWEANTGCEIHMNNHHDNQYVTDDGYTSNRIENTFSWYKRGFGARITHCKYHQLYLNEFVFRYNNRELSTEDMFNVIVSNTIGKHVTYKQIREYNQLAGFKIRKKKHVGDLSLEEIKKLLSHGMVERFEQNGRVYTYKDMLKGLF